MPQSMPIRQAPDRRDRYLRVQRFEGARDCEQGESGRIKDEDRTRQPADLGMEPEGRQRSG